MLHRAEAEVQNTFTQVKTKRVYIYLTRSACLFKESDSAETTVVEKAPSSKKKKKKRKKKKQTVQEGNASDDDDDDSTAVGSPVLKIMSPNLFGFVTFT